MILGTADGLAMASWKRMIASQRIHGTTLLVSKSLSIIVTHLILQMLMGIMPIQSFSMSRQLLDGSTASRTCLTPQRSTSEDSLKMASSLVGYFRCYLLGLQTQVDYFLKENVFPPKCQNDSTEKY